MTVAAGGLVLPATSAQAATENESAGSVTVKAVTSARSAKRAKAARQQVLAVKAVTAAKKQIGDPYRFGGTGPGSFDCSGLVQFAWKKAGVKIPRITYSQFARIRTKVSYKNLRAGDLMFFSRLGHVGMYLGKGKMIHAPRTGQRVRIEKLSGWRKSSFVGAVRPGM